MSSVETSGQDEPSPSVNAAAFNALFTHPKKNRDQILIQIVSMVRIIARAHINCRTIDDADEIKGEGREFGISLADRAIAGQSNFDASRGTAYDYFYTSLKNYMVKTAARPRSETLGDADSQISFDELRAITPRDAARAARSNCFRNWTTFRLSGARDRMVAEKFLRVSIKKAQAACPPLARGTWRQSNRSRAERAATAVMIQTLKQVQRALLG